MSKSDTAASEIARLRALVAEQAAQIAALSMSGRDPFVIVRRQYTNPKSGVVTTFIDVQNVCGAPLTIPAGHEVSFVVSETPDFDRDGRVGNYAKMAVGGVKRIPERKPAEAATA